MRVGILGFQGGRAEHAAVLNKLGHTADMVTTPEALDDVTHLVLPGGESTTLRLLLKKTGLLGPLLERIENGTISCFGTCAGAILLSGWLGTFAVERNAYGAQQASGTFGLTTSSGEAAGVGMFIRAPRFTQWDEEVEPLAFRGKDPVVLRSGRHMALTFHPELTGDTQWHERWLEADYAA